jgi:hypothetical protein
MVDSRAHFHAPRPRRPAPRARRCLGRAVVREQRTPPGSPPDTSYQKRASRIRNRHDHGPRGVPTLGAAGYRRQRLGLRHANMLAHPPWRGARRIADDTVMPIGAGPGARVASLGSGVRYGYDEVRPSPSSVGGVTDEVVGGVVDGRPGCSRWGSPRRRRRRCREGRSTRRPLVPRRGLTP